MKRLIFMVLAVLVFEKWGLFKHEPHLLLAQCTAFLISLRSNDHTVRSVRLFRFIDVSEEMSGV